jgi:hypothetical protein
LAITTTFIIHGIGVAILRLYPQIALDVRELNKDNT